MVPAAAELAGRIVRHSQVGRVHCHQIGKVEEGEQDTSAVPDSADLSGSEAVNLADGIRLGVAPPLDSKTPSSTSSFTSTPEHSTSIPHPDGPRDALAGSFENHHADTFGGLAA